VNREWTRIKSLWSHSPLRIVPVVVLVLGSFSAGRFPGRKAKDIEDEDD
jgi:hypothetical protein